MKQGFDILIVSTRNSSQEEFWYKRLRASLGAICKPDAVIITVEEDWPGGAGTGLGTLYAYQKALEKAKFKYHCDLQHMHRAGASVALYHTAGCGKKLYPLVASEGNSTANLHIPNSGSSLLETVIQQTNEQFSINRGGRLSVFHCDQIFYPAKPFFYVPDSHIDLFCRSLPSNDSRRQLVALEPAGAKVIETAEPVLLMTKYPVAENLSAFSLSLEMVQLLLEEFKQELAERNCCMNANSHFWMPLTLDYKTFLSLNPFPEHQMHYHRMSGLKKKLNPSYPLFKPLDIGAEGYRWDFSTINTYYRTLIKLTKGTPESLQMKHLFGLRDREDQGIKNRVIMDRNSCLIGSEIRGGTIKNSVLIGVKADSLNVENSVIVNSKFPSLETTGSLLYNVSEKRPVKLASGTVRADVRLGPDGKTYPLYSHLARDAVADWNTPLPQNPLAFSEIHQLIEQSLTCIG